MYAMADIDEAFEASNESSVIILAQATDNVNTTQAMYASPPDHCLIDSDFVLLESQSTVDLFSNPKHVQNICPASKPIKVHCNKGSMAVTQVADFGDTEVYINTNGIANMLYLFCISQKHQITYDRHDHNSVFVVHTPCGVAEFYPTRNGLHIVDLNRDLEAAYLLVNDADLAYWTLPSSDN
jgi:hypothetical protein